MSDRRPHAEFPHSEELTTPDAGDLRVLILEDVASDAELAILELRHAGMRVSSRRVEERGSFLHELDSFGPDVVLADFRLPGMTALDALEIVKQRQHPPVFILVTGSQSEEIAVDCIKQGADDYLLKASLKRLPTAVINALTRHRSQVKSVESERALRESEVRFRLMFAMSPLPTFLCDSSTLELLESNQAASERYGYAPSQFLKMKMGDLLDLKEDGLQGLGRFQKADGSVIDVRVVAQAIEFGGRKASLVIVEDITERLHAERQIRTSREQLRALSAHLQSVREEERTRIAREIHDELGQAMTALRIDLLWIGGKLTGANGDVIRPIQQTIIGMTSIVDATIRAVRRIATELRPGVLDDLGLISAIEWQAQEFQQRTDIKCRFATTVPEIELDRTRSTAVFRILQETLTNVARHAQASHVDIRLERSEGELLLEIADDGRGVSEDELHDRHSLGILGMRERALLLGGDVVIKGRPGDGTIVTVRLPLPQSSKIVERV